MTTVPQGQLDTGEALPAVGDRLEERGHWVEAYSRAKLPTRFGEFEILVFHTSDDDREHVALVHGKVRGATDLPVRLHSECLTGDVFGSVRCDCRAQLEMSLVALGKAEAGVLLYMRQEGRGIGLGNKIRAYTLQENGLDTFEANRHLGFDDDLRSYTSGALMLKLLGVESIALVTNNPRKLFGLRKEGIVVSSRVPIVAAANPHNRRYLETKAKAGHLLPFT